MCDWPIGLSTGCFYRKSIFDCIDPVIRNGFALLEICSSIDHLDYHDERCVREAASLLDDRSLEAYSFHAPFSERIDITSFDGAERREAAEEILRAAKAAALLHARYFVLHPGPEKNRDIPDAERYRRMNNAADVLAPLCEACAALDIDIVFENMLPHLFCGAIGEVLWLLGRMRGATAGICLDTGHAFLSGNISEVTRPTAGHLSMVHANDNRGKGDDHLPPGRGEIDWTALLRELHRIGFAGGMIIEISGDDRRSPDEVLGDARRSRLFLRHTMRIAASSGSPEAGHARGR